MNKQQPATKISHATTSPYGAPIWPTVAAELELAILNLLVPLLSPIGQYRDHNVKSGRARHKKRTITDTRLSTASTEASQEAPEILHYVTVGFNSTVRHMEHLSQQEHRNGRLDNKTTTGSETMFVAVFVNKSAMPDVMTSPLPLLAATASPVSSENDGIRLIPLSPSGTAKIAEAIKQPRVNVLGLMADTPGAAELCELIRQSINPIAVPWIREAKALRYRAVQIHSVETVPGEKNKPNKRKREDTES